MPVFIDIKYRWPVRLLLICLIALIAGPVNAQMRRDSLRELLTTNRHDSTYLKTLLLFAIETRKNNIDSSKIYFQQAQALAHELGQIKIEVKSLNGLGISHGMLDEYVDAIRCFTDAQLLASKNALPLYEGDSYNSLGVVYKRIGEYPTSLDYYAKALHLYDSLDNEQSIASCYENMGILFDLMKQPDQAMENYRKALAIHEKNGDEQKRTIVYSNIAVLYLLRGEAEKAIVILERNSRYYEERDMKRYATQEILNLGHAYYEAHRYPEAEKALSAALSKARDAKLLHNQIDALCSLAKMRADLGNYASGVRDALEAMRLSESGDSFTAKSKAYEALSYAYEKSGALQKALASMKTYQAYQDSLFNESKSFAFVRQQVLLEVRNKDEQIRDQALSLALLDKQVELEYRWKLSLAVVVILLLIAGFLYYLKYRTKVRYSGELERQNVLIRDQKEEIETINQQLNQQFVLRKETDDTINYFATSLFGKNTIDEILWDVAKNCISRLGLVDCVIYLVDTKRNVLVQKAAYGGKNPEHFQIQDPIEIPLGKGIVGSVAQSGVAEIVNDTSRDPRYIVDDEARSSELAVPLIVQNKVIGVIDTEHPDLNFFTQYHLESLTTIASICASKISQADSQTQTLKAREAQREADQIKELDQIKSQFFANISHEFRTPLNLILAPLQRNDESLTAAERQMMIRNAKRLLRLVNQLLDLSKIEGGMLKPEFSYINVFGFVSEIANAFILLAGAKEIAYRVDIPEHDFVMYTDPDKLEKIVYNLLSNAFKFTPKGGAVMVTLSVGDGQLQLKVSDNGIGIPKHQQALIFTRFYQADASQTRSYEGSGIGLALTRELIDLLGGRIDLVSDENKGCEFLVTLPLKDGSIPEVQHVFEVESNYYPGAENIAVRSELVTELNHVLPVLLLVEDNPELQNYVKTCLVSRYNVLVAGDGQQGLEIARQQIPDLVVTDIMMPVMDGVTLTSELRGDERTSHIPVILLTARVDEETRIMGFETGAEQYLVKPFNIEELVARIHSLLSRRETLRRKFGREVSLQPSGIVIEDRDALFLQKLVEIIEAKMARPTFSVEELQSEIGMSRMQLHRKLKALTNQSASDFIRTTKLKRAAQILKQPGIQISEAAYLAGFNHMSYFSKCFKEQFGVLPSDFVKEPSDT